MVYRFINENREYFGLRWLCQHFGIGLNCYYNYLEDKKNDYHTQSDAIYERIKYIYYNNNRTVGHRAMRIFLSRYGIHLSKTTIHKYMNKDLNLATVIMLEKPGYKACKKHRIFDNLLNQNFLLMRKTRYGALSLHICASLMDGSDTTVPLLIYTTEPLLPL